MPFAAAILAGRGAAPLLIDSKIGFAIVDSLQTYPVIVEGDKTVGACEDRNITTTLRAFQL
jgi:hypothetical protein